MEIGIVQKVDIDEEMQQSYLDYAMSVIVARALPDARDGLKPVHRRILYAMYDMGLRPDTPYKKSARIVGEVLGKYHPHGDMAVYEAMARMAQEFSMRYALVDGQGNFGSVDGDSPAAMRYTEARLHKLSMNLLADIQKDTVTFDDNFDGTLQEPGVLPAAFPNLLVNGATGIAVGMSTSIPPHNLGEVVDAIRYMLDNWEKLDDIDLEHLMRFIQGPDFPTGAIIIQEASDDGLTSAYGTGRGRVTLQARAHLEEMDRGRSRIIVTELPYMTNKASLIERIATLVREERLEGVADLRDESDRHGMRIVIELSRGIDPEKVLRDLYRSTPMQSTFSIILLALVDGEPRLLNLKQALKVYVEHRLEIVRRRSQHDLEKARQRAHILEGYRVALKNLDEVISLIRKAPDAETARDRLMKRFKLSQIQAQAILDLQLRRLAALERKKIDEEYKEVQALIKDLESLLRSPRKMRAVVGDELQAVRETYGDGRRTQIVRLQDGEKKVSLLTASDLTPQKNTWITVDASGLISRSQTEQLPAFDEAAAPLRLVQADSRDTLYLVTEHGEAAAIAVHNLPETASSSQGIPFHKVSPLSANDRLAALFSLPRDERTEDRFVLTVSRQGMVKKSALSELPGPSSGTFNLARVNEGDRLGWARISSGQDEVLLVTARGFSIRFKEEEVRPMGLVAAGVLGIKLQAGDEIAGAELLPQPGEILAVASDGTAKRTAPDQFPQQGRYGQGVILWKLDKDARVVGVAAGPGKMRVILHLQKAPPKSIRMQDVSLVGRAARGQAIKGIKSGLPVTAITAPQVRISPNGGAEELPDEGGAPPAGGVDGKAKRSRVKPSGPEANGKVGKAAGRGAGPAPKAKSTKGSAKPGKKPASRTSLRGSAATEAIPSDSSKDEIASQKPLAMTDDAMTDAKKATPKARSTKASSKKADPSTSLRMPDEKPATDAKKATPKAKSTKASSKKDPSTSLRMPEEKPDAAAKKAAPKGKTTRVSAKSKAGEATEAAAPKKKSAGVKEEGARRAPQPAAKKPATRGKKAAESEAAPAKTSKRSSTRAAPSPTAEEKPKATGRKKPTQPKLI